MTSLHTSAGTFSKSSPKRVQALPIDLRYIHKRVPALLHMETRALSRVKVQNKGMLNEHVACRILTVGDKGLQQLFLFSEMENMEHQSDPSTTNKVILVVKADKDQVKLKKAYNVKAATAFGPSKSGVASSPTGQASIS